MATETKPVIDKAALEAQREVKDNQVKTNQIVKK